MSEDDQINLHFTTEPWNNDTKSDFADPVWMYHQEHKRGG